MYTYTNIFVGMQIQGQREEPHISKHNDLFKVPAHVRVSSHVFGRKSLTSNNFEKSKHI